MLPKPSAVYTIEEIFGMARGDWEPAPSEEGTRKIARTVTQLEDQVKDISAHQDAVQSRVKHLKEEIRRLEQRHGELELMKMTSLNAASAIHSLNAPWRRLPRDLMEEIFSLCLPLQEDQCPSLDHAPFLLTRVCSSWYRLAQNIPRLWSTIMLTSAHRDSLPCTALAAGIQYLYTCINRAKKSPIRLYVRTEFLSDYTSFKLIDQICPQVSHISLTYSDTPFGHRDYFTSEQLAMPNMKTFEIHQLRNDFPIPDFDLQHLRKIADSSNHLERFISCVEQQIQRSRLPTENWLNLRTLHLANLITLPICLAILRYIPTLQQFSSTHLCREGDRPGSDPVDPLTHPCLHTITLLGVDSALKTFFELVTAPKLHNLIISRAQCSHYIDDSGWLYSHILHFLKRSDCRLKNLEIAHEPIRVSPILEILQLPMCTGIENLTLWRHHRDEFALIDLAFCDALTFRSDAEDQCRSREQAPGPTLCPNLQILELDCVIPIYAVDKFIAMIESRISFDPLPPASSQLTSSMLARRSLKILHGPSDWNWNVIERLEPLYRKGLVWVENDRSKGSLPLSQPRKELLKRFIAEGFDLRIFDPYHGKWVYEAERLRGDLGFVPTSHDCAYCGLPSE